MNDPQSPAAENPVQDIYITSLPLAGHHDGTVKTSTQVHIMTAQCARRRTASIHLNHFLLGRRPNCGLERDFLSRKHSKLGGKSMEEGNGRPPHSLDIIILLGAGPLCYTSMALTYCIIWMKAFRILLLTGCSPFVSDCRMANDSCIVLMLGRSYWIW